MMSRDMAQYSFYAFRSSPSSPRYTDISGPFY